MDSILNHQRASIDPNVPKRPYDAHDQSPRLSPLLTMIKDGGLQPREFLGNAAEPRQTKIVARLSEQGAMLEELRAVLPVIRPTSARDDARRAILEDNVLRRPSISSRRKIFEKLSGRYFRSNASLAVARLVQTMQMVQDPLQNSLLAYVMLLWNDPLVFQWGAEWLAPKLGNVPYDAESSDIDAELDRLSSAIPRICKWAPITRRKIVINYLTLLRDCGYATGTFRKRLRRPFIEPDVVLFGVQLIIGGREAISRLPEHLLFKAMGLSIAEVVDALTELQHRGCVDFAVQGGIVHFALRGETISR
jgi:Putative inner membrane protein (DUF1819)